MTVIRERLAADLAGKVERHGVVIWDDPERAYADVVTDVAPAAVGVQVFDRSWFRLRREIESSLAGQDPPSLVVYVPCSPAEPDPLEELRAVGARFRVTLPTLLKNSLAGRLTEHRITQIAEQCSTLREAEAAVEGGGTSVDARLISIVGDTAVNVIATALVSGAHEAALEERGLDEVVRTTLAESLGGAFGELPGSDLRAAAFRQVVLTVIHAATGEVPIDLAGSFEPPTGNQRRTCAAVVNGLRSEPALRSEYVDLAQQADEQLHIGALLEWHDGLTSVDVTPAIEQIALTEGFRRLERGDYKLAIDLADARLAGSWWVRPEAQGGDLAGTKWRAISALASLEQVLTDTVPSMASLGAMMQWYTSDGWQVDAAYRHSEFIRVTSGVALDELDELFHRARERYEGWLDTVLQASATAVADTDVPPSELQRSIHERHVRRSEMRTAYVLVDALRYELGRDLSERLASVNAEVTTGATLGTPPSITPVGMAALLPGADTSFEIDLDDNGKLLIRVGGDAITGVGDRVKRLEHAHGKVVDVDLDRVAQLSNKELKAKVGDAALALVRSTEIDADGETDLLAASWGSFDTTLNVLHTAVAKLLHAGMQRVVITSDHGFLAVRQLGEDRRIDKPVTGIGDQHRRAWIGRGGSASASTIKIPLSAFGITSDVEIISPRGLGVFASGGGLQFFHGGLSPQELVIPVIVAVANDTSPEPHYKISMEVAGGRVTTGVIAVTVSMTGDLFTRESRVRLQLVQDTQRVAAVVGGDGFDQATDTVDATVDLRRVLTMQVTSNLLSGSTATLEVLDAATGVRLAALDVEVAADVLVADDLV